MTNLRGTKRNRCGDLPVEDGAHGPGLDGWYRADVRHGHQVNESTGYLGVKLVQGSPHMGPVHGGRIAHLERGHYIIILELNWAHCYPYTPVFWYQSLTIQ